MQSKKMNYEILFYIILWKRFENLDEVEDQVKY